MSWFAELAGKAEDILTNLDEKTGAALRNQAKHKKHENTLKKESLPNKKKRHLSRTIRNVSNPGVQVLPAKTLKTKLQRNRISPHRSREDGNVLEPYGYKPRRNSYPMDIVNTPDLEWLNRMENLEVENAMLKNELNVSAREFNELLNRLSDSEQEMNKAKSNLESMESKKSGINENLAKQIEKLKSDIDATNKELGYYKEEKRQMETEISVLRERNQLLSDSIEQYENQDNKTDIILNKTENDLRHSQSVINHLRNDLAKTKEECKRLETEWEAYKMRVKNMLKNKDKEIKALQQGVNLTEDTKILVDQLENLKDEREMLSKVVSQVRGECADMKRHMDALEAKHCVAERVVVALRDALKDERYARSRIEANRDDMAKVLKDYQVESEQKIAILQKALRDMENGMNRMMETPGTSSVATTVPSAINVADFDSKRSYQSEEQEKIEYLTEKLIQRQEQVEKLMADNVTMKIQLQKLEYKLQSEIRRGTGGHSVVSFQDGGHKLRATSTELSLTSKVSRWCGLLIRTHPLIGILLVLYVVCLNIWVFSILFASSQETKAYYNNHTP